MHHPPPRLLCAALLATTLCGTLAGCDPAALTPAEYPEVKVSTSSFSLELKDPRRKLQAPQLPPLSMYKNDKASAARALPAGFASSVKQRLSRISSGQGIALIVHTRVRRAEVTFYNDHRGDFTRFDVELEFRLTTENGALLMKGIGASWRELASKDADLKEQARVFEFTALDAFDRYFASEDTLEKLNEQIKAYLKQHPQAAK
jgi:hypothetical protein